MTAIDSTAAPAEISVVAQRLARRGLELIDTIAEHRARRARLRALEGLDTRILEDVGLSRADLFARR